MEGAKGVRVGGEGREGGRGREYSRLVLDAGGGRRGGEVEGEGK